MVGRGLRRGGGKDPGTVRSRTNKKVERSKARRTGVPRCAAHHLADCIVFQHCGRLRSTRLGTDELRGK